MKAIKTKFIGPTNTKPSRIKASVEGVTSKIYQSDIGHEAAALAFCEFHDWDKHLAHGQLDADTWVHCFVPERAPKLVDFLKDCVTGKIERGEAEAIVGIPALPKTDNQKIQAFLDWKNNFLTLEKFADYYGFTPEAALEIISAGRGLHETSCVPVFTVVSVSDKANTFGYKGVLLLCEDGRGFECLYQAYGVESVPQRGTCLPEDKLPTYCRRELSKITPEKAASILK